MLLLPLRIRATAIAIVAAAAALAVASAQAEAPASIGCGVVSLSCGPSCGAAIARAVEACSAAGGGTVHLLPGTYTLNDTAIPLMQPVVAVTNIRNVVLRGSTSVLHTDHSHASPSPTPTRTLLMLVGPRAGFSINNSSNVTFADFDVDTSRPMYTYGRCVTATDLGFTVEFNTTSYPFPVHTSSSSWLQEVGAVLEFDPVHWRPAEAGLDVYATASPLRGSVSSPGRYTVSTPRGGQQVAARVGAYYILRHEVYSGNGFSTVRSDTILFHGVRCNTPPFFLKMVPKILI